MRVFVNFSVGDLTRSEEDDSRTRRSFDKAVEVEETDFNEVALREAFEDFVRAMRPSFF